MGVARRMVVLLSVCLGGCLASIYITFFHHPPAAEILKNQMLLNRSQKGVVWLDPIKDHHISEIAMVVWNKWVIEHDYIAIGDVWDTCDEQEKITIGKMIMLPDPEHNGVKCKTVVNASFDATIEFGEIQLDVQYNHRNLFSNTFDLCTADTERVLVCPIKKGSNFYNKEVIIPSYIPKGLYEVEAKMSNQEKKIVMCASCAFTI